MLNISNEIPWIAVASFVGGLTGAWLNRWTTRTVERDRHRNEMARMAAKFRLDAYMELWKRFSKASRSISHFGRQTSLVNVDEAKVYWQDAHDYYYDFRPYFPVNLHKDFSKLSGYISRWIANTEKRLAGGRTTPFAVEGLEKRMNTMQNHIRKDLLLDNLDAYVRKQ